MEYTYNLAFIDTSQTIELPSFSNCSIGISGVKTRIRMFDVHLLWMSIAKVENVQEIASNSRSLQTWIIRVRLPISG